MRNVFRFLGVLAIALAMPVWLCLLFLLPARGAEPKCMSTINFVAQLDANADLTFVRGEKVAWFVAQMKEREMPVSSDSVSFLIVATLKGQPIGLVVLGVGDNVCDPVVVPIEIVILLRGVEA